ncbi:MAG: hypothetical protein ABI639_10275 [Thermoanaerobaculia bacterium]
MLEKLMRHPSILTLALTLAAATLVAVVGCKPKIEPAASAAPAPSATSAPAATAGEIGVAACDEYLNKWESCLATKVTGDAREQVKVALDASRDAWKRAAATPEGKAGLAAACQQATDVAKMQVSAYGCTW